MKLVISFIGVLIVAIVVSAALRAADAPVVVHLAVLLLLVFIAGFVVRLVVSRGAGEG
jgi:hypothetical protein